MLSLLLLTTIGSLKPQTIRLEAEAGVGVDVRTANQRSGFSGAGYVTDITKPGSQINWTARVPKGMYDLVIGYSSPGQAKGTDLTVDGIGLSGMLPATGEGFARTTIGRVEATAAETKISLKKGWGFYELDYVELVPASAVPKLKPVPLQLSDPLATPATKALFKRLVSAYGKSTLSGQYDDKDTEHIVAKVGVTPAIFGADFIEFSPSRQEHGAKPQGSTEKVLARAKRGQIVTYSWHWNAPKDLIDAEIKRNGQTIDARWYKGFYTEATTFDVQKALANKSGEDYRLLLRDIDVIAAELKKFAAADIPVLWRPLHEAEGGWFWWGAKGPQPCNQLWALLRERLMKHHKLHNLIWVWNSIRPDWYPGDDQVDIVGADLYPSDRRDATWGTWDPLIARFNGKKLLALTEYGQAPEVDRMHRFGVRWSYFVSWTGNLGASGMKDEDLRGVYASRKVLNLKRN